MTIKEFARVWYKIDTFDSDEYQKADDLFMELYNTWYKRLTSIHEKLDEIVIDYLSADSCDYAGFVESYETILNCVGKMVCLSVYKTVKDTVFEEPFTDKDLNQITRFLDTVYNERLDMFANEATIGFKVI